MQITPLPGAWPQKPGSATFPFFGVQVCKDTRAAIIIYLYFPPWMIILASSNFLGVLIKKIKFSWCKCSLYWWMKKGTRLKVNAMDIYAWKAHGLQHLELFIMIKKDMKRLTSSHSLAITLLAMAAPGKSRCLIPCLSWYRLMYPRVWYCSYLRMIV